MIKKNEKFVPLWLSISYFFVCLVQLFFYSSATPAPNTSKYLIFQFFGLFWLFAPLIAIIFYGINYFRKNDYNWKGLIIPLMHFFLLAETTLFFGQQPKGMSTISYLLFYGGPYFLSVIFIISLFVMIKEIQRKAQ